MRHGSDDVRPATTRVHHAVRRCGGNVAARGERAAARAHADFLIKQIDDDAFLHKTPVLMS
jgi:hypothetical protein